MRRIQYFLMLVFVILFINSHSSAAEFNAREPFLLTTAGQSADILMVKILAQKAELNFAIDKMASADTLNKYSSLIFVSGGSTKGLGAAKIDKDQELRRVRALIDKARALKIPIITMHMGGKARRGNLSDEFNSLASANANCLIVVKSGDDDGFFSTIAKEKNIPIFLIEKTIEAGGVLKSIFGKKTN